MKSICFIIVGAATFSVASPIFAQSDLVTRYSHWEWRLRHRVSDQLSYPAEAAPASGDVLVGFRIGPDGKPTNISVHHSSGNPIFDRAALRLVSRLGHLGPVPSANPDVNEIVLKLSYGDPSSTMTQSIQLARADRQEQLGAEHSNRALIAGPTRVAQGH